MPIEIDGKRVPNFPKPEPKTEEPKPTSDPEPKPVAIDGWAKKYELEYQAKQTRFNVENGPGGNSLNIPQTEAQKVRTASAQVERAFESPPEGVSPQQAASEKLVEVTANQPPEVVALIIEESEPTIDKITEELGETSKQNDGDYNRDRPRFDDVVTNLAIVANRAAEAPNGEKAIDIIAGGIAKNIEEDGVGRFDEALGKVIENGAGTELSIAVVDKLIAAGKVSEAEDILQNFSDGVNGLNDRVNQSVDDYNQHTEELNWLVANWSGTMTPEELESAVASYKTAWGEKHGESFDDVAAAHEKKIDELGGALIKTVQGLEDVPEGYKHVDKIQESVAKMLGNEKVMQLVNMSPKAQQEIGELLVRQQEGKPTFLDNLVGLLDKTNDALGNAKKWGEFILKAAGGTAAILNNAGHEDAAWKIIEGLKKNANLMERAFGLDTKKLGTAIGKMHLVFDATDEESAKAALESFDQELNKIGLGSETTGVGQIFRGIGLMASAVNLAGTAANWDDASLQRKAQALSDAAGIGSDGVKLLTGIFKNSETLKAIGKSGGFESFNKVLGKYNKALGVVGVGIETFSALQSLKNGELVEGGLKLTGALGSALLLSSSAAATGVGFVLVVGAAVALAQYGRVKASNKHENDLAKAFLQGAGTSEAVANKLMNADNNGRSIGPVIMGLADHLGVDPKDMFDWLAQQKPDDLHDLIEGGFHAVDPDSEGNFNTTGEGDYYYENDTPWGSPKSMPGLVKWLEANGFGGILEV